MKNAAFDAMENEKFVLGESVYKFEEEFAKYCNTEYDKELVFCPKCSRAQK